MIWLARKVITRRGAIGTSTPVLGLRPTRSPLSRRMKVPKPEILTFSPSDKRVAHVVEHPLDQARALGARQAEAAMDRVGKVGAGQGRVRVRVAVDPRDAKVRHDLLPLWTACPRPSFDEFVTNFTPVGNSTFAE